MTDNFVLNTQKKIFLLQDAFFFVFLIFVGVFPLSKCPTFYFYDVSITLKDISMAAFAFYMIIGRKLSFFHSFCWLMLCYFCYASISILWSHHPTGLELTALIHTAVLGFSSWIIAWGMISHRNFRCIQSLLQSISIVILVLALTYYFIPLYYPTTKWDDWTRAIEPVSFVQFRLDGPLLHAAGGFGSLIPILGFLAGKYVTEKKNRYLFLACCCVMAIHCMASHAATICLVLFFILSFCFSGSWSNFKRISTIFLISISLIFTYNLSTGIYVAFIKNQKKQEELIANHNSSVFEKENIYVHSDSNEIEYSKFTENTLTPVENTLTPVENSLTPVENMLTPVMANVLEEMKPATIMTGTAKTSWRINTKSKIGRMADLTASLELYKKRLQQCELNSLFFGTGLGSVWSLKSILTISKRDDIQLVTLSRNTRYGITGFFRTSLNGIFFNLIEFGLVGSLFLFLSFILFLFLVIKYRINKQICFLGIALAVITVAYISGDPYFGHYFHQCIVSVFLIAFIRMTTLESEQTVIEHSGSAPLDFKDVDKTSKVSATKILMVGPHTHKEIPTGGDAALFELTIDLLRKEKNIEVVSISTLRPRNNRIYRLFSSLKTLFQILHEINKCDVVMIFVTNASLSTILRILLPITKFWKKPLIVKKFGGRAHNDDYHIIYPPTPFPEKIGNKITKQLKQVDLYLPETKHAFLAAKKEGIPSIWFPNYRVLASSLHTDCSADHTHFRCVFIGRVVPEKGINEIIQADSFYNDNVKIDVFGPLDRGLVEHDFQFLKHVKYCGKLDHSEVADVLSRYQVFVFPSYNEGHPGSLIEALAAGLPIITTDRPFIYEVVTPNEALIIPAQNVKELALAVNRLAEDEQLRKQLSKNGILRSRMFDAKTLIPFLADCCRNLVLGKPLPIQNFEMEKIT